MPPLMLLAAFVLAASPASPPPFRAAAEGEAWSHAERMSAEWDAIVADANKRLAATPESGRETLRKQFKAEQREFRARWNQTIVGFAKTCPAEPALVSLLGNHLNDYTGDRVPHTEALAVLEILQAHHLKSDRISGIVLKLKGWEVTPEVERFLKGVVAANPDAGTRAVALMQLADLYHEAFERPGTTDAARLGYRQEAERLFEEVRAGYPDAKTPGIDYGVKLERVAERRLYELRNLVVGKAAPEAAGVDVAGKGSKLSDHRGKVVVLDFWHMACVPCVKMIPHQQALVKRLEGEPFVMLGVNTDGDRDRLTKFLANKRITWPVWLDRGDDGVNRQWDVRGHPTTYVLDHRGTIRFKNVFGDELDAAVDQLLAEQKVPEKR